MKAESRRPGRNTRAAAHISSSPVCLNGGTRSLRPGYARVYKIGKICASNGEQNLDDVLAALG